MCKLYIFTTIKDILQKPPDVGDVFTLISNDISAHWFEVAGQLKVSMNYRTTLRHDSLLSDESKLETVLTFWAESETREVTWEVVVKALDDLGKKPLAKKVVDFLDIPETIAKYISRPNFVFFKTQF